MSYSINLDLFDLEISSINKLPDNHNYTTYTNWIERHLSIRIEELIKKSQA